MNPLDYVVGDKITYRNFLGGPTTGYVVSKDPDIKNGRAGFDLATTPDGNAVVWGYDDQIVRVVPTHRS